MGTWSFRRAGAVVALAALTSSFLIGLGVSPAAAAPPPDPITDYANYPAGISPALIPDGCTASGFTILTGLEFTNGEVTSSNLEDLGLLPGDIIEMSWSGFAAGCEATGISLSFKRANRPFFDPLTNQDLLFPFDYCGPLTTACATGADGRYHLSLDMRPRTVGCNWQVDAVIGPPLMVVGPAGSYYNSTTREDHGKPGGPNMLISADNGGLGRECGAPDPEPPDVNPNCAAGGFDLVLRNIGDVEAIFEVTVDDVPFPVPPVGPESTDTVLIPAEENSTPHIVVTSGGETLYDDSPRLNCLTPGEPSAAISYECGDPGINLTLINDGEEAIRLTYTWESTDGTFGGGSELLQSSVTVDPLPIAEGETVTIVVRLGQTIIAEEQITRECETPGGTITVSCTTKGATVALTNTGEVDTVLTVTKNGNPVEDVTVPAGGSVSRTYPMLEDETATFRASNADFDTGAVTLTLDCADVGGVKFPDPTGTLPATGSGSSVSPFVAMAGLLLLVGGLLVAAFPMRRPAGNSLITN